MAELTIGGIPQAEAERSALPWRIEDVALGLILAAMAVIPVAEILLRRLFAVGISGSAAIVQHCTLLVTMLGAAVAARDKRLISFATAAFLEGRVARAAAAVAAGFAATICLFLMRSGYDFVIAERAGGNTLSYGVPLWIVQTIIPIGFALIALRLISTVDSSRSVQLSTAALTVALTLASLINGSVIHATSWAALILAALAGTPLFAILGGATLILNWQAEIPLATFAVSQYSLVVNPALPAIPLFTLAGSILAAGGASRRLLNLFRALVGSIRGGPAIVTVVVCAFFTSFTGGSGVTILALGGLLLPVLRQANYSEKNALGLITAAGSLGLLVPPCLPMILYAIQARVEIKDMFLGAIVPGIILIALTATLGILQQQGGKRGSFDGRAAWNAVWSAKWELLIPVAVIAALLRGWATPMEVAALTAVFALLVETVIHDDLRSISRLMTTFREAGLLVGSILIILCAALAFTGYLVDAQMPELAADWVTAHVQSPLTFLLLLNLFLLAVGALMDIYSAVIVVVPLIVPLGAAFGIDPVHLGVIFLTNLELGYLLPPVGENLFISSSRFGKPIGEICRATLPMIAIFLLAVAIVTYVPMATTFLPARFGGPR